MFRCSFENFILFPLSCASCMFSCLIILKNFQFSSLQDASLSSFLFSLPLISWMETLLILASMSYNLSDFLSPYISVLCLYAFFRSTHSASVTVQSLSRVWLFVTPMDCSTIGLPVHHQFLDFTQTHVPWVSDAIQPSHPLSSPSPPAFNLSQHQGLFKSVTSSHQVAKVFEFQL